MIIDSALTVVLLVFVAVVAVSTVGIGTVAGDTTAADRAVVQVDNDTASDADTTSIGVVAEDADAGTNWATELDDRFATYDAERVTSGQALGNLSEYDAYFVLTLADNDTSAWFDETDDVPTVYTVVGDDGGDDPLGSKSLVQRSNTIGTPGTAGGYTDGYLSWTVTTDHPLFDGVASVGEEVIVSGKWYADGGSFTGASATAIADTNNGERGVAIDDGRRDVLLGSVGSSTYTSPDDYTNQAFAVVANALEYYADVNTTIEGTVTDTDGSPIDGATVEAAGNRSLETTTDADGTYDVPVSAGEYTLNVSEFGYETVSTTVNVSEGETATENVTLSDALDAAVLDGQSERRYASETIEVEVDIANADTVTVENVGTLTSGLTLLVDGQQAQFGGPVNVSDPDGTLSVTVETTGDTEGTVELEHTLAGAGDGATVTTGPTSVVDTLFSIAVVDDWSADDGQKWAATIGSTLENTSDRLYEVEHVTTGDVLGNIDAYDAYFAHYLGTDNESAFINATDGVPTVYTSQKFGPYTLKDRNDVIGDPEEVIDTGSMSSWAVTTDHSIFDGVADPGDTIAVHGAHSYGSYFTDTGAAVLATVPSDSDNNTVAIDEDRRDVLLTSLGAAGYVEVEDHSEEALAVLANALTEFVAEKATIGGQVTDTDGTPLQGVTVDLVGQQRETTTDVDGTYELSVLPGNYTLEASAFGYEPSSTAVTVSEGDTVTENVTIAEIPEAAVLDGQADNIESGNATISVTLDVANADTITVENVGTLTSGLTLFVDGAEEQFGDAVTVSDADGTVDVAVTTTNGTGGTVELEHTVAGVGDGTTVTTGPTEVFESFTRIGVVSGTPNAGTAWADAFDDRLAGYEAEWVTASDALDDLDAYDAYFVFGVGDRNASWFSRTDDRPTLYASSSSFYSVSLVQRSNTIGDPATVTGGEDLDTWQVTVEHPLFDGVADPGEQVQVHTDFSGYGASFTGTSADVLANARNGQSGVAIDEGRQDVLLASVGSGGFADPAEHTDDAFAVFENALDYYTAGSATITGTVTDTNGDPIDGATVGFASGLKKTTTDANGTYELPVAAGNYTLSVGAFGYESTSATVSVSEDETITRNATLADAFDVRLAEGQTGRLDSGTDIEVTVDVANVDTLTVENVGSLTSGLTLLVDGQQEQFGDPVTLASDGTVDVTVETTDATDGTVELEHTAEGLNETETVTTGPTEVYDELFSIGVIDDLSPDEGQTWARTIESTLANRTGDAVRYEAEQLSSGDALADIDAYDSYFVHTVFTNDDALVNATDGIPTVYTSQLYGPSTLEDRADVLEDPEEVVGQSAQSSWEVTANHSIFDGVADPGDQVLPLDGPAGYGAYFNNTDAEVLATPSGDPANGSVAVDDSREDVLLTVIGSGASSYVEIEDHSDAGIRVLVNALTEYIEGATGQTQFGGTGIGDATVDVVDHDQQVRTTSNGHFVLPLESGTYTLEVSAPGFETTTETITVGDGELVEHNFELTPTGENDVGDVDRDGEIDIVDAVRIQRHLAGLDPGPFDSTLADVDRDGEIDIVDVVRIQRLLAQIDEPGTATVTAVDAPDSVPAGDQLTVSTTVENAGDLGTIQAAEFTFAADGGTVAGVIDVVDLAASESATVETTIDTSGLAPGTYTLEIATDDDTETVTVTITSSSLATTIAGPPGIRP